MRSTSWRRAQRSSPASPSRAWRPTGADHGGRGGQTAGPGSRAGRSPTRAELEAARGLHVDDVLRPDLEVVFCGINPGLYTAWAGQHFGRPGNRFWPALHLSGFTARELDPGEQLELLDLGLGVTNLVARTTARADELARAEIAAGGRLLEEKARRFRPRWLAVLGVTAFRVAFGDPSASVGPQARLLGGSRVWLLPNPSGLNAHYRLADLAGAFGRLREAAGIPDRRQG